MGEGLSDGSSRMAVHLTARRNVATLFDETEDDTTSHASLLWVRKPATTSRAASARKVL